MEVGGAPLVTALETVGCGGGVFHYPPRMPYGRARMVPSIAIRSIVCSRAQAVVEGLTLVSKDRWLRELGAEVEWE